MQYQHESQQQIPEIIEASNTDDQFLLVSNSFYEIEEQHIFPIVQLDFYCRFKLWIDQISCELGVAEVFTIGWGDYPEDSTGMYLAVWDKAGIKYELELQQEDRECPLIILFRQRAG